MEYRIREIRKSKLITQKELARMVGVDYTVISRYERGTIEPSANRLKAIAEVLGVSIDSLIKNNDPVSSEPLNRPVFGSVNDDRYAIHDYQVMNRILAYANGICELCGQKAPFTDNEGKPFLEVHHIQWLSEGGLPVPENTVALCPNCHRKIHVLHDTEDIQKLKEAAKRHQEGEKI